MKKALLFIESEVSNAMLAGGLPANLQGYQFIKEATIEVLKDPTLMQQLTKRLYPKIGAAHNINAAVVERSMRHVIEVAYRTQSIYGLNDLLQTPVLTNEKPCNGNLIALIAEIVKKDLYHILATTDETNNSERSLLARDIQTFFDTYYGEKLA